MAIKVPAYVPPSATVRSFPTGSVPVTAGKRYTPSTEESMGFKESGTEVPRRIVASLEGLEKSGKDHCALTGPEPIYLHSFDRGIEGVVEKFRNGKVARKKIYQADYPSPDQVARCGTKEDVQQEGIRIWKVFESQFYDSLASTRLTGTVIVDTGGECMDTLTLAEFGRTSKILPRTRGPMNARMQAMIRASFGAQNVYWLHKLKDDYKTALGPDGNAIVDDLGEEKRFKTGLKAAKWFAEMPYIVQLVGRCERYDLPEGGSQFTVLVKDSRHNPDANGLRVENGHDSLLWALHDYVMPAVEEEVAE